MSAIEGSRFREWGSADSDLVIGGDNHRDEVISLASSTCFFEEHAVLGKRSYNYLSSRELRKANRLVFADANAADEGKFQRGFVKIDTEIQAEQVQLKSFFTSYGDTEHTQH